MDYKALIDYFGKKITRDNITAYAAQAALFILLSAIPFLLVFVSLIRFTPVTEDMVLRVIEYVMPGEVAPWLSQITDEVYHNSTRAMIFNLVFAVYSSAKCIHSLRNGLNTVYEVKETRNWFKLRLRAMIETFFLIVGIVLLLVLVVFGEKIRALGTQYYPDFENVFDILLKGRLVIIFFVMIALFTFIYKAIPNRPATFKSQLIGAIGCTAAWYIFSIGLSIVIRFFNGFSLYGSLATVVICVFWLDICMIIFFVCGEVNNAFEMIVAEFRMAHAKKVAQEEDAYDAVEEEIPFEETVSFAEEDHHVRKTYKLKRRRRFGGFKR